MADKVQKIREEVERLQSRAEYNFGISLTENARQFWLGESNVLTLIGKYIGTMQKEPVKIKKGCKYRCLSDMINRDTGNIAFIGDNIYFAPRDNTLVSEEYGLLCDTSADASNFELVEESKKCMFTKDYYTDEDRKALCDGCKEECKFNNKEESVSEDLEETASRYAKEEYSRKNPATLPDRCIGCYAPIMYAFKAGANWQKQKDKSKVLTEEQCRKIRDDAFELGKDAMKQQLMKKAFSAEIGKQRPDYKCVLNGNFFKYDTGDKVKLIIIKEE